MKETKTCIWGRFSAVMIVISPLWLHSMPFTSRLSSRNILSPHLKPNCLAALTWCSNCPGTMADTGPAAKKTITLHAAIKLLLKSPLLAHFHSVSFCLVSGQDLQVSGCDIRDSVLSTPNRLYKDARQKNSNMASTFICLGNESGRGGKVVNRVSGEGEKGESGGQN